MPPHTRIHPEPNLVTHSEGRRGHGNEAQWSIGEHHHASGMMVIAHIPELHSLADQCTDSRTVEADGDASEVPERGIISPRGRLAGWYCTRKVGRKSKEPSL